MPARYDAVTFDFWNTLCLPDNERFRAERLRVTREVFAADGISLTDEQLDAALVAVFERFNESWAANEQFTAPDAAELLADLAGPGLSVDGRARLTAVYLTANRDSPPPLNANVAETLRRLKDGGLRIGIICDVGMAPSPVLRGFLEHHGVLQYFDHWSFSDEVGVYKPHPEIFEHALAGLGGVEPARAVHVGDLRRTDVAGAIAMGMTAVRYRGSHDDNGGVGDAGELVEGHHVIDDHIELLHVVGLA